MKKEPEKKSDEGVGDFSKIGKVIDEISGQHGMPDIEGLKKDIVKTIKARLGKNFDAVIIDGDDPRIKSLKKGKHGCNHSEARGINDMPIDDLYELGEAALKRFISMKTHDADFANFYQTLPNKTNRYEARRLYMAREAKDDVISMRNTIINSKELQQYHEGFNLFFPPVFMEQHHPTDPKKMIKSFLYPPHDEEAVMNQEEEEFMKSMDEKRERAKKIQ